MPGDRCVILSDDHNLGGGKLAPQNTRCLEAVHARHVDIHQHDVRMKKLCLLNGFDAIAGFAADSPVGMVLNEAAKGTAEEFVIIGDQYFDGIVRGSGRHRNFDERPKATEAPKEIMQCGKVGSSTVFHR